MNVTRSDFVKNQAGDYDAQIIKFRHNNSFKIETTVIIPSLDGYRNGYLPRLLDQIQNQTYREYEVIIVKGDPRPGRAINKAVCESQGDFLIILDDDTQLGHNQVFEKLISQTKNIANAGMVGVPNLLPKEGSFLVKNIMKQIPRRHSSNVKNITESDLAEHPCCAIPKNIFLEVGGENELIPRGIDPYLRHKIREAGYKVFVIPEAYIHHLPPPKLKDNIVDFFNNGKKAGYVNKYYPEFVVELATEHGKKVSEQRSFGQRLFSYAKRLLGSILSFKVFYSLHLIFYSIGFIYGYFLLDSSEV